MRITADELQEILVNSEDMDHQFAYFFGKEWGKVFYNSTDEASISQLPKKILNIPVDRKINQ